jgi:hypothetical protein
MANATCKPVNHLLPNLKSNNNKKPLTQCPLFRSKPMNRVATAEQN